ncbi:MAG TPA: hypothetical protein VFM94_03465 [Solirubrobacterales bacterium]|nr:hypothetical protein [Solirubrobacterales bacterium]
MRRVAIALAAVCLAALALASGAGAHYPGLGNFGINSFDVTFTNEDGTMATLSGSHPFAMTTSLGANVDAEEVPEGRLKDFFLEQIPGLVGDTTAYPRCSSLRFLEVNEGINDCPIETAIGISASATSEPGLWSAVPVFNLTPPPGVLLRLGFRAGTAANIVVDVGLSQAPPYSAIAAARNTPQIVQVFGNKTQLWGDPSAAGHDDLRGICGVSGTKLPPGDIEGFQFENQSGESCPVGRRQNPFLTLPTNCSSPLTSAFEAFSWEGEEDFGERSIHDAAGNPQPFTECGALGFAPEIVARPTSKAASSPSGLDFSLQLDDEGLTSVDGRAQSDIRRVEVTLPRGMTANPSLAEGLEVCSEEDLEEETLAAEPGEGCPEASKIGTLEVETPLVEEPVKGALFQATPFENEAEDALIAFYIVFKNPHLGVIVKQAAKVVPDPKTGQLTAITDQIPQLPFSSFNLHFREGSRSPLITPSRCGTYEAKALITPWSGSAPVEAASSFQILSGPGEEPCPSGGAPPFEPGFEAGSENNSAGAYSPFSMRLTRRDGDQDLTRFDATLPPGVLAKLAGVDRCPDAQISLARAKTGKAERRSPSCPSNSRIGSLWAGAGAGSQLTYVPGQVYLAGSFGGEPLSVVAIVPAVAGPFDVGTVVTRQALDFDPRTGEVTADGASSEPLPHILAGIPLVVRDIQVHVNRLRFSINPTSCARFSTRAAIWGGGLDPFSIGDDAPVARESRYQAASCASLGFEPSLRLRLIGGTRRGAHPKLRSVFRPRVGDANLTGLVLRLPRSAFLEQGHIRTICTRVQFAAKACPEAAIYGHARAFTPLLSEPLVGPVYLRSSNHNLPDFVADLHGLVDVEAVARVDSKKGGIRATFTELPDAPLTKVEVDMQGGRKGLIVNSTNLCARKHRADARLEAHNGRRARLHPVVGARCGKNGRAR